MIPFYYFAFGLCGGLIAQAAGIWLRLRRPGSLSARLYSRLLWLVGVLLILATATYDHDALLFCGQLLAAYFLYRWLFRHD